MSGGDKESVRRLASDMRAARADVDILGETAWPFGSWDEAAVHHGVDAGTLYGVLAGADTSRRRVRP